MAAFTTVDDSTSFINPKLYTGTGSSLATTGVGFQSDFTWLKNRDQSDFWTVYDSVRGATKYVKSNADEVEVTNAESLKSFDSDGFTVGTMAEVNTSTENFVSWNWKMGSTTGIGGSPSITPTAYSFNATAGQSIILWTGTGANATLPHGLGVAPEFMIVKNLSAVDNWLVYHQSLGNTKYLKLNGTNAAQTSTAPWNDTSPTSTLFSIGDSTSTNGSGNSLIAYCFAPVQGYSKFGIYEGWANSDGPFVNCGFRPAWVLIKGTGNTWDWEGFDNKRKGYNGSGGNKCLQPSNVAAESTEDIDLLSNGFKIRDSGNRMNQTGYDYVYAAFAEQPIANSESVPSNAR